jgi:hypothetical protein
MGEQGISSSSHANSASIALSHSAGGGGASTYDGLRETAGSAEDAAGGVRGSSVSLLDALEVGDTERWTSRRCRRGGVSEGADLGDSVRSRGNVTGAERAE